MSWFGDGTLKQNILEDVLYRWKDSGVSKTEIILALLEIIGYIVEEKEK